MSSVTQQLTTTSSALVARAKDQWAVVHAQWIALPETVKAAWEQIRERIQVALELPTKEDLGKLSTRLDELDAKIAALISARESTSLPVADVITSAAHEPAPPTNGEIHAKKLNAEKRSKKKG